MKDVEVYGIMYLRGESMKQIEVSREDLEQFMEEETKRGKGTEKGGSDVD